MGFLFFSASSQDPGLIPGGPAGSGLRGQPRRWESSIRGPVRFWGGLQRAWLAEHLPMMPGQHWALRSTVDFRGSQLCEAQDHYPPRRLPRESQKHQHGKEGFGEFTCSSISRCEGDWRTLGWTFAGIPQGADTLGKTSHRISRTFCLFLLCTVPGDSSTGLPVVILNFSRKQLRDISLSFLSSPGDSLCGPPPVLRTSSQSSSYSHLHRPQGPAPPVRGSSCLAGVSPAKRKPLPGG